MPVCGRNEWKKTRRGFTIIELMITMAIMAILAALASLLIAGYLERAKIVRAIADIHTIQNDITSFQIAEDRNAGGFWAGIAHVFDFPAEVISEVDWDLHLDPWGHPYQYTNFDTAPKGKWRKDKFLVPINSAFDLWSMGPDGTSVPPLTAKTSKDDIIRANDGAFIGKASLY